MKTQRFSASDDDDAGKGFDGDSGFPLSTTTMMSAKVSVVTAVFRFRRRLRWRQQPAVFRFR